MRRIPIAGDDGKNKTWGELFVHYQAELENFKNNIAMLKDKAAGKISTEDVAIKSLNNAAVKFNGQWNRTRLDEGAVLLANMPEAKIVGLAPELKGLTAFTVNGDVQRKDGTTIDFECSEPVKLLVAYFKDDQKKYAKAPKLETDATANEYGQADRCSPMPSILTRCLWPMCMPIISKQAAIRSIFRKAMRLCSV